MAMREMAMREIGQDDSAYPDDKAPQHGDSSLDDEKPLEALQSCLCGQILEAACQWPPNNL